MTKLKVVKNTDSNVRVAFPGGDIDIIETSDGSFWVHIWVNLHGLDAHVGRFVEGRMDIRNKHASECPGLDVSHKNLYHVAVRVEKVS